MTRRPAAAAREALAAPGVRLSGTGTGTGTSAPRAATASLARRCTGALVGVLLCLPASLLEGQVVINEIAALNRLTGVDEDGDSSDWLELYNAGAATVDLLGYGLSDDPGEPAKWVFPHATLAPGEFALAWCSGKDRTAIAAGMLEGAASIVPFEPSLVSLEAEWRYLVGAPEAPGPPADWKRPVFDDSAWERGRAGFGFGDDDDVTVLPQGIGAVFLRHAFRVASLPTRLVLEVTYDDGFVAYLNGVRVAAANFPADEEPLFSSRANGTHEALRPELFDLTPSIDLLEAGDNLLAMVALNRTTSGNDLSLIPRLGTLPPVFHTSFRLSGDGETVLLSAPGGRTADEVTYPPQVADQTYGRRPDGSGGFLFHLRPTPLAPNDGPTSTTPLAVARVRFEPEHGFFDRPFDLTLATETAGAEIRYTTDGTEPTATRGEVYEGPIRIGDTTALRAAAFKPDHAPSVAGASSYIFIETVDGRGGVLNQPANPPGFPRTWGSAGAADYGMDPRVTTDATSPFFQPGVREGLLSLASMSIIMDPRDLFDPRTGVYSNPQSAGVAWERPASAELIYPDARRGFQINCALRIQGGASRNPNRPKHNLRLLFKTIYGPGKLEFPLFDDTHVTSFDTIILRGGNGDSWFHPSAAQQRRAQYIRDQWHRDTQIAQGRLTAHQAYMHLYINGLYWGMYHIFERPNASFLASYLGGDEEEYDALNLGEPVDGDLEAWNTMFSIARGGVADPAGYARIGEYLDVPNLIDWLLVNYYSGNIDWDHNNWYAGRRRVAGAGYKFFAWDSERTFWNPGENRVTVNTTGRPTELHTRLRANPEYRLLFADHVQRHFFNGGALTPGASEERWMARVREIEVALAAESARWGDNKRPSRPYTPGVEWRAEIDNIRANYLARRTDLVLAQLRAARLYPNVVAPSFLEHGGRVSEGFRLAIYAPEGVVYSTTDGTDPRLAGGEVSPAARPAAPLEAAALLETGAAGRLLVPTDGALGLDWVGADFDDGAWEGARTAVGYERDTGYEDLIATDLEAAAYARNSSVYLRLPFVVDDPASVGFLSLRMKYDDGFVAFLNGVRVAAVNAPEPEELSWDSRAVRSHPDSQAALFEDFEIFAARRHLRSGRNVLAIQALNIRPADADLLLLAELHGYRTQGGVAIDRKTVVRARALRGEDWSAMNEATFLVGAASPVSVTEIMYHPPAAREGSPHDREDFEYLELQNVGGETVDVSELRLSGAIEFDFSTPAALRLESGAYLVVVKNRAAFASRYDTSFMTVAGEYRRNLGNDGEVLRLEGPQGETLLEFAYDDAWYPSTDGDGHSLVLIDPASDPETWGDRQSWRPSRSRGGSPGEDDRGAVRPRGLQLPGDVSQDGGVNLADVLSLLRGLFDGGTSLPCTGGDIGQGGNAVVHDINGDDAVNLTDALFLLAYLFQSGAPPALGTECVSVTSCPDSCRGG